MSPFIGSILPHLKSPYCLHRWRRIKFLPVFIFSIRIVLPYTSITSNPSKTTSFHLYFILHFYLLIITYHYSWQCYSFGSLENWFDFFFFCKKCLCLGRNDFNKSSPGNKNPIPFLIFIELSNENRRKASQNFLFGRVSYSWRICYLGIFCFVSSQQVWGCFSNIQRWK